MKIAHRKLIDAQDRAQCVRRYRRWVFQLPRPCHIEDLVDELSRTHRAIKVSHRSLARWHNLAGDPIDTSRLVDRRTGRTGSALAQVMDWWDAYRADPDGPHAQALAAIDQAEDHRIAEAIAKLASIWAWQSFQDDCADQSDAAFANFLFCLRSQFTELGISRRSLFRWRRLFRISGCESLIDTRGGRREYPFQNRDE